MLVALATQGFQELAARMREARGPKPVSLSAGLQAIGNAYVAFAREHSALFRLMFGLFLPRTEGRYPELKAAADEAHGVLLETIRRGLDGTAPAAALPEELAVTAWSVVHGLSFLVIDGHLTQRGFSADLSRTVARVTEIASTGIAGFGDGR